MGSLYPGPGLYSKYYTVDHEPLLELVQDTCGATIPSASRAPRATTRIWDTPAM